MKTLMQSAGRLDDLIALLKAGKVVDPVGQKEVALHLETLQATVARHEAMLRHLQAALAKLPYGTLEPPDPRLPVTRSGVDPHNASKF